MYVNTKELHVYTCSCMKKYYSDFVGAWARVPWCQLTVRVACEQPQEFGIGPGWLGCSIGAIFNGQRFPITKTPPNSTNIVFLPIIIYIYIYIWSWNNKIKALWPRGANHISIFNVDVWKPKLPTDTFGFWCFLDYQ